jgi:type IV pilus modification protein PilV
MAEVAALRVRRDGGVTLVEVLVTLVILAIGLLGLVAMHARVQVLQAESYQRAQALILLKDMAGRIANNRNNVATYVADFAGQDMVTEGVGAHLTAADCPAPDAGRPTSRTGVPHCGARPRASTARTWVPWSAAAAASRTSGAGGFS